MGFPGEHNTCPHGPALFTLRVSVSSFPLSACRPRCRQTFSFCGYLPSESSQRPQGFVLDFQAGGRMRPPRGGSWRNPNAVSNINSPNPRLLLPVIRATQWPQDATLLNSSSHLDLPSVPSGDWGQEGPCLCPGGTASCRPNEKCRKVIMEASPEVAVRVGSDYFPHNPPPN